MISRSSGPAGQQASAGAELNAVCTNLTARQRDVLAVMMQGKSNKAICRILNLAEPTVKNHVTAILKALKVTNRTEAVIKVAKASARLDVLYLHDLRLFDVSAPIGDGRRRRGQAPAAQSARLVCKAHHSAAGAARLRAFRFYKPSEFAAIR